MDIYIYLVVNAEIGWFLRKPEQITVLSTQKRAEARLKNILKRENNFGKCEIGKYKAIRVWWE